ncbi:MAG: hypothetical protein WD225_15210 [Ilumatobacteraceae bacterium]
MDDHFVALSGDEDDNLEQLGRTVRADDQPSIGVVAKVVDDEGVFDGVEDVVVDNAVTASGPVDLHTPILYYETFAPATGSPAEDPPAVSAADRREDGSSYSRDHLG